MSTTPNTRNTAQFLHRRLFKRAALIALLGGIAITAGVGAVAQSAGIAGWHHGAAMTAQNMSEHVDKFLQHVYIEMDATDAQKAQLDPIVKQAVTDLMPLHGQFHDFHTQALTLLTQDTRSRGD